MKKFSHSELSGFMFGRLDSTERRLKIARELRNNPKGEAVQFLSQFEDVAERIMNPNDMLHLDLLFEENDISDAALHELDEAGKPVDTASKELIHLPQREVIVRPANTLIGVWDYASRNPVRSVMLMSMLLGMFAICFQYGSMSSDDGLNERIQSVQAERFLIEIASEQQEAKVHCRAGLPVEVRFDSVAGRSRSWTPVQMNDSPVTVVEQLTAEIQNDGTCLVRFADNIEGVLYVFQSGDTKRNGGIATIAFPVNEGQDSDLVQWNALIHLPSLFSKQNAVRVQQAWSRKLGIPVREENGIGMRMRMIPPGQFIMGSSPEAPRHEADEIEHCVVLTVPFRVAETEVTQKMFEDVMGTNPSHFSKSPPTSSVEMVTWFDAIEFCNRLSKHEGIEPFYRVSAVKKDGTRIVSAKVSALGGDGYRLLSEAEWEYCCRAGTNSYWSSGNDELGAHQVGWLPDEQTESPMPVGQKLPNSFGLYDMHGNVWEWVHDWYDTEYYPVSPFYDPRGPKDGKLKVFRGGSYDHRFTPLHGNSTNRGKMPPETYDYDRGFRVARSISQNVSVQPSN